MADPLVATRRLGPVLLDVPRGTPPLLVPRVRRLASVSAISLCSPHPGRGAGARLSRARLVVRSLLAVRWPVALAAIALLLTGCAGDYIARTAGYRRAYESYQYPPAVQGFDN